MSMRRALASTQRSLQRGFGLLEVSLLLLIVGSAVVAGLIALKVHQASLAAESEIKALAQADLYLQGFVAGHNRLPCPATDDSGLENCANGVQKGRLPYVTLGLEGSMAAAGTGLLAYEVQRQAVDLTTAIASNNLFEPVAWNSTSKLYDGHRDLQAHSTSDFCQALTNAGLVTPVAGQARVGAFGSGGYPVAYALAHPGRQQAGTDAASSSVGAGFDGLNATSTTEMELPERGSGLGSYDDRVVARTYQGLAQALDCDRWRTALNSVSLAVSVVEEVESQRTAITLAAGILTTISGIKAIVFGVKIGLAAGNLSTGIGYASTAAGLLSAAIASCVVLVGCFEIPHAAASLAAAVVAIVASGISIGLNAGALVSSVVAFGITTAAAVAAGNQPGINSVDITSATATALSSRDAAVTATATAQTNANNTAANLITAQNLRDTQWTALINASHKVVDAVNARNSPNPPRAPDVLLSNDFLDTEFMAVRTAANAWKTSQDNLSNATANLTQATNSAANSNATPSAATRDQIARLTAQLNAVPPPDATTSPTYQEIQSALTALNAPSNSASNIDQAAQLQTNITTLNTQIAAIDTQLASTTLTGVARDDLVTRRATLADQSADLTRQLVNISLTVASATQAKADATTAVTAAQTALENAYNHALAQFSASSQRLPYIVCSQVPDPNQPFPPPNPLPTHEACVTSYANGLDVAVAGDSDGADVITPKLYRLFNTATVNLPPPCGVFSFNCPAWIPNGTQIPGSYYNYWNLVGLNTQAQTDLTNAKAKQVSAQSSYDALNGLVTTGTTLPAGLNVVWTAPVDALKQIELNGAIR